MEFLLLALFGLAVAGSSVFLFLRGLTSPRFNSDPGLPAPVPSSRITSGRVYQPAIEAPRRNVSPEVQAELDQTTEWWDSEFHRALELSGAEVVEIIPEEYESVSMSSYGGAYVLHERVVIQEEHHVLAGCSCSRCS